MPSLTNFSHQFYVDWLRGETITSIGGLFAGVLTAEPNADGSDVLEPNVGNYQRKPVELTEAVFQNGAMVTSNDAPVLFNTATADWPLVTHMGVFDDDSNLLFYGQLAAPRAIKTGDVLSFATGSIQLRLK